MSLKCIVIATVRVLRSMTKGMEACTYKSNQQSSRHQLQQLALSYNYMWLDWTPDSHSAPWDPNMSCSVRKAKRNYPAGCIQQMSRENDLKVKLACAASYRIAIQFDVNETTATVKWDSLSTSTRRHCTDNANHAAITTIIATCWLKYTWVWTKSVFTAKKARKPSLYLEKTFRESWTCSSRQDMKSTTVIHIGQYQTQMQSCSGRQCICTCTCGDNEPISS